jgi:hypothetical protein
VERPTHEQADGSMFASPCCLSSSACGAELAQLFLMIDSTQPRKKVFMNELSGGNFELNFLIGLQLTGPRQQDDAIRALLPSLPGT